MFNIIRNRYTQFNMSMKNYSWIYNASKSICIMYYYLMIKYVRVTSRAFIGRFTFKVNSAMKNYQMQITEDLHRLTISVSHFKKSKWFFLLKFFFLIGVIILSVSHILFFLNNITILIMDVFKGNYLSA